MMLIVIFALELNGFENTKMKCHRFPGDCGRMATLEISRTEIVQKFQIQMLCEFFNISNITVFIENLFYRI
jgi:hypothetical protein